MDNVTKIKFQYFKPLEKGTEKRKAGGSVRLPRGRSAGRGGGESEARKGRGLSEGRDLPGGAPLPRGGQRRPDSRPKGSGTPRARFGASHPAPQSRPPPAP